MNKDQIALAGEQALAIVNTQLPLLKLILPAVAAAGGPVTLGIAAAAALLPLIRALPVGGLVDAETQQKLMDEVNDIVSGKAFEGPEWQIPPDFVWPANETKE